MIPFPHIFCQTAPDKILQLRNHDIIHLTHRSIQLYIHLNPILTQSSCGIFSHHAGCSIGDDDPPPCTLRHVRQSGTDKPHPPDIFIPTFEVDPTPQARHEVEERHILSDFSSVCHDTSRFDRSSSP